ncbi:hypothetical protein P168DRAFT_260020 [Aspergillus campestris IBT 28561]|uniref:L-tryptophan decarboxylase PsiD-like domain-containing protein n=1 Tax=Aspergillus campestris (strain IBT 28561) TaxID=1392248 RepID=A0A2I1CSD5_ASPC2|nr:uncharacterized protein P168DRAFT_260020 [Aspergillus campestris IBT 28561]PKY00535.1 hypothetical protein P168DRAFT_260020 [Aspergillus campestris IBT 28561]
MPAHHSHAPRLHHIGRWMPSTNAAHHEWLGGVIDHVDKRKAHPLHPAIEDFKQLIESNTRVFILVSSMFEELPRNRTYSTDPTGTPQIRDYHHLLHVLNYLITTAPTWSDMSHRVGLVGLPINAVLDWSMGTPSGYAAYLDPDINAALKKILDAWGAFLSSPASAECINPGPHGWLGPTAKPDLCAVANEPTASSLSFEDLYVCDPAAPHHGYTSWDDFFTRLYRPGIRPVADPHNEAVIANACESTPYKIAHRVKSRDRFWIKSQPYSLQDMLAHDPLAHSHFTHATVYQAFLSALSYHRWHAPVSGTIHKAYTVPGTYYAEPLFEGIADPDSQVAPAAHRIDLAGQVTAQEYNSATATRAIIFIDSHNPAIGMVGFIAVGMCEVSTCDITVRAGQQVHKGDELGMFHFGGSTHCLVFREGIKLEGLPVPGEVTHNVPVKSKLGTVNG